MTSRINFVERVEALLADLTEDPRIDRLDLYVGLGEVYERLGEAFSRLAPPTMAANLSCTGREPYHLTCGHVFTRQCRAMACRELLPV